jgi:hypothetical protein
MKERINRYTIALLSVIMMCLLAVPAMAGYAYDGFSVNTMTSGTVQGDLFVSHGNKSGLSASPFTTYIDVPGGSAVWARLYVGVWGGHRK